MGTKLDELLHQVAVIGACGKMGRGIATLLLQEMTLLSFKEGRLRSPSFHLKLIDVNQQGFYELKVYLNQQLQKFAEKNINILRTLVASDATLVSNEDIINAFLEEGMRMFDCSTAMEHIKGASLVFEAAFEDIPLKSALLRSVNAITSDAWVLSNTSSIPISLLAEQSGLGERLIGCHFYNPPVIQKLIELIPSLETSEELEKIGEEITERLNKIKVTSADVAGFIGNGHFAREILFACNLVSELEKMYPREIAIQIVDTVTKDYLLRPMGIFQLLDYVGLSIAYQIFVIMRENIPEPSLKSPLLDNWKANDLQGGQTLEGHPKNGIFSYLHGKPEGIYSYQKKAYIPLSPLPFLGKLPSDLTWKNCQNDPKLKEKLEEHFAKILESKELGCELAKRFLERSFEIEEFLVKTGVAGSLHDVSKVLKYGFYHLYSPHEVMQVHKI